MSRYFSLLCHDDQVLVPGIDAGLSISAAAEAPIVLFIASAIGPFPASLLSTSFYFCTPWIRTDVK